MDSSNFFSPNLTQNVAILTVVLAFIGYLATFLSARMLARRRDKLDLVNKRLNEFYGPLYVASQAGTIAYRTLLQKQGKTQCHPILDDEMKEWVLWMKTIFMPSTMCARESSSTRPTSSSRSRCPNACSTSSPT